MHEEIHSCGNETIEILSRFVEKTVILVSSVSCSCDLLFNAVVKQRQGELIRQAISIIILEMNCPLAKENCF
jgi:hypothetical protein